MFTAKTTIWKWQLSNSQSNSRRKTINQ